MPRATPDELPALTRLLDETWRGLAVKQARAHTLGADWWAHTTPFVDRADGEIVAHVGVLSIPMVQQGRRVEVAGIHAVCCAPRFRRQGRIRALLAEALSFAERAHPTQVLLTDQPAVYESAGFRVVPQHRFELELDDTAPRGLRRLDPEDPLDLACLHGLLARRAPTSKRLGVVEPGWLFIIDEVLATGDLTRLYRDTAGEVIVAAEPSEEGLLVYDIVFAGTPPPLRELLGGIASGAASAWLHFAPDRFDVHAQAVPWAPPDALMVRGSLAAELEREPFALSPLAYC
ncbi:MAG: GNAT family N-acetyltransferase [Planctomycetota bacterium]